MICAPAGGVTRAPSSAISPSRMTIVPRSIGGEATGTRRALMIASVPLARPATWRDRSALAGGHRTAPVAGDGGGCGVAAADPGTETVALAAPPVEPPDPFVLVLFARRSAAINVCLRCATPVSRV